MKRPDPMLSASYGATDIVAQQSRMLWLEELYLLDGREQHSHTPHGLLQGFALKSQNLDTTDGI